MHPAVICRTLGIVTLCFSATLLPVMLVSIIYDDGQLYSLIYAFIIDLSVGLALWLPCIKSSREMRIRDGFLILSLFWILTSLLAAIPFYISPSHPLSFTDAYFEAMSGITTTGASIFNHLESLPKSILWYRQQLQWVGGMSIIVLAMSLLPMLGIGGMHFQRAASLGQIKESKLSPRLAETAKSLSLIYLGLTLACGVAYWLAGMGIFDAITHSFSTVSIGGFSTHTQSIGYFQSPKIEWVAIIFMVLSGANFVLHFHVLHRKSISLYWRDSEFKFYLSVLGSISAITILILYLNDTYSFSSAFLRGLFETVSFVTTSGFKTADYSTWPKILPYLLLVCAFIGGCIGSTAGGLKMTRIMLIYRQGLREIKRLIHPNAIIPIKVGKRPVPEVILRSVWGFFSVYMFMFVIILMGLLATGLDQVTAWSAVSATLNNVGPGLGAVAQNYASIPSESKWILSFSMLLGRVEVFTLLIIFSPEFWKR
jgi:trk system potassium uptake protein TrkH